MFSPADYDFHLPEEFISQTPVVQRDQSKLLVLNRKTRRISHHKFYELYDLLSPSDLLVVNNTEVVPARLFGHRDTGGKVEILILDYHNRPENRIDSKELEYHCLIKASKRLKPGTQLLFDKELNARVITFENNMYKIRFFFEDDFETTLYRIGHAPIPPYIKRKNDADRFGDRASYQTVYASKKGAIAAPTAGLHFTKELIEKLNKKGVFVVSLTLHVGYGTFLPVRVQDIREHTMHSEQYVISKETADSINLAKAEGRRIVAVGTTTVRTLEYMTGIDGKIACGAGNCDLFIYPGYTFKSVDSMITNFHLPKSTLLMLVSAFAGRDIVLNAYQEAIKKRYGFYSYGDAMFIR